MSPEPRLAFVLDALPAVGGGERTLFAALEVFPEADIYTLIYNKSAFTETPLADRMIGISPLDRLPFARSHHRLLLPLMPSAIQRLDLCRYDLVVAFSYAVAHGVQTGSGTRQIAYMYTPMRYAWSDINIDGTRSGKNRVMNFLMENFRRWDTSAAARVDEFVAISHGVAGRIRNAYRREARVIYPPVDVDRFSPGAERQDYFVSLSRLVPHKRLDVVVDAFSRLRLPLKVIGEGPERNRLQKRAAPNIEFVGYQSDGAVAELLARARGFVCAAEEDFGIAIVEAQAAGCPVIAYKGGGALETVIEEETGLFFPEQSPASLIEAVRQFEESAHDFRSDVMLQNAQKFSKTRFQRSFREFMGT
jgi:glycosyltransferase involved in cell wall biosynthesis